MSSSFNNETGNIHLNENFVEIGSSLRYRYYKTRRNGELMFVKRPTHEFIDDLVVTEALRKEYLLGFRLNHPGIVRYYFYENKNLYEEYLDGKTLRELIENDDRLLKSQGFLEKVAVNILEALDYIHSKGVVHLDLKPENIMITNLGHQIKIIDLNSSKDSGFDTTPGYTPEYMSPEQKEGKADVSTDIFHVGKIMEELAIDTGLEKRWRKFVSKSIANHPDNRFKSAREALDFVNSQNNKSFKWIGVLLGVIIIGGLIAVIVSKDTNPEESSPIEEQGIFSESEKTNPDTGIMIPEVNQSSVIKSNKEISEGVTERELTKKIHAKLIELYSIKVTPMYEKMMQDPSYKYKNGIHSEFVGEYMKAFNEFQDYGKELSKIYPDKENFIKERVIREFEVVTGEMLENLYPTNVNSSDYNQYKELTDTANVIIK